MEVVKSGRQEARFVYLQPHGEGKYKSKEKLGDREKKLIGKLTIRKLRKIPPENLMEHEEGAEPIYSE